MNNKKISQFALSVSFVSGLLLASAPSFAETKFDFAGFASFTASKTTTKNNSVGGQSEFNQMSDELSIRDLSLLGLRTTVDLDHGLSFGAQAVMYGRDDFKPKFDWVYASYRFAQDWDITVGRSRIPLFMYSAYQDVSYAYPWLSPPYTVYGLPQFKSVDGLKLRQQTMIGSWSSDFQFWYGSVKEDLKTVDIDSVLRMRDNVGLAWDLEHDWFRFHSVYMTGKTSVGFDKEPTLAGFMDFLDNTALLLGMAGQAPGMAILIAQQHQVQRLKKQYDWDDVQGHFGGLGVGFDFDTVFANAEATLIYLDEQIAAAKTMESYYVSIGTRIVPKWTFTATFTYDRDREHKQMIGDYQLVVADAINTLGAIASGSGTPAPLAGAINQLLAVYNDPNNAALTVNGIPFVIKQLQHYEAKGFILGARWDFHKFASAKLEYLAEERTYGAISTVYRPQAFRIGVDVTF